MYSYLDDSYKIYVYLLPQYISKLMDDARNFEILKKGNKVNMNQFFCMLIEGYYEQFSNIDKHLKNTRHFDSYGIKEKRKRIMIRPTKENKPLFDKIITLNSSSAGVSQYFAHMLMSYCDLSMSKREQIIFHENYSTLRRVSNPANRIRITFKTKYSNCVHEAIPYKMVVSKEEMFNYLLCAEINQDSEQIEMPFRLNRLLTINCVPGDNSINEDVERHLIKMEKYAPQYRIEDDVETCVRLTDEGVLAYERIYFGRPDRLPNRDEEKLDGHYYYFDCSTNQLFLYFRRFGCEAEIVYPENLRNRMKDFHSRAYAVYEKG